MEEMNTVIIDSPERYLVTVEQLDEYGNEINSLTLYVPASLFTQFIAVLAINGTRFFVEPLTELTSHAD